MNKLVIGNLKMNLISPVDRERYISNFKKEMDGREFLRSEIVLCPAFIHLEYFKKELGDSVGVGAQNMFFEREGSYTGEVSGAMVKNIGCDWVILGHSERRRYFGEGDSFIAKKINSALKLGLKVVLCVGEKREERARQETPRVISRQIMEAVKDISKARIESIVIAYEPVWAVGTDKTPSSDEIMEAKIIIRKLFSQKYDKKTAEKVKILYGGSVNANTVGEVVLDPAMDGALIGRESLVPYDFLKIVEIINE